MSSSSFVVWVGLMCEATNERFVNPNYLQEPPSDIYTVRKLSIEDRQVELSSRHSTAEIATERQDWHESMPAVFPAYARLSLGSISLNVCMPTEMAGRLGRLAEDHYTEQTYLLSPRRGDFNCHGVTAHLLGWQSLVCTAEAAELFNYVDDPVKDERPSDITGHTIWTDLDRAGVHSYLRLPHIEGGTGEPLALSVLGRGGLLTLCPVDQLEKAYAGPTLIVRRIASPITN